MAYTMTRTIFHCPLCRTLVTESHHTFKDDGTFTTVNEDNIESLVIHLPSGPYIYDDEEYTEDIKLEEVARKIELRRLRRAENFDRIYFIGGPDYWAEIGGNRIEARRYTMLQVLQVNGETTMRLSRNLNIRKLRIFNGREFPASDPSYTNSLKEVEAATKELDKRFEPYGGNVAHVKIKEKEDFERVTCDELGLSAKIWKSSDLSDAGALQFAENRIDRELLRLENKALRVGREEMRGVMEAIEAIYGETWDGLQRSATAIFQSNRSERDDLLDCQYCGMGERTGYCLFPWSLLKIEVDGSQNVADFKSKTWYLVNESDGDHGNHHLIRTRGFEDANEDDEDDSEDTEDSGRD